MRTGRHGYAAEDDPPAGARPARDTGVSVAAGMIATLTRERDEALTLAAAETERANHLADALHGSYGTEHRWREDYDRVVRERDEVRAALEEARCERDKAVWDRDALIERLKAGSDER